MSDPPAEALFLEIADDPRVGGKARSLARLRQAGLPTPEGFVVTDALFATLLAGDVAGQGAGARSAAIGGGAAAAAVAQGAFPTDFSPALSRRLQRLGGAAYSVRSSFASEDDPQSVAAGIFESRIAVPPAQVASALRQVLASAVGPAAAAYARARGRALAEAPVSVLVHRHQPGDRSGGAAWDPAATERDPVIAPREGPISDAVRTQLEAALRALAVHHGAIEIEWVADGDRVTFLQMRPYRAPPARPPWPGAGQLPPGADWRWDASHNPLPLSSAQAGLVALVDAHGGTGFRQQVAGGYLFWAPSDATPPAAPPGSPGAPPPPPGLPTAEVSSELAGIVRDAEAALLALGDPPALEPALQTFVAFYQRIFGVLRPAMDHARVTLRDFLSEHHRGAPGPELLLPALVAEVESQASERRRRARRIAEAVTDDERQRALAAYLDRFGDESPVWDVAAATHRDDPQPLLSRLRDPPAPPPTARRPAPPAPPPTARRPAPPAPPPTARRPDWRAVADDVRAALPASLVARWDATLSQARAAAAAAEDDDWIYARLQAAVRRALLDLGHRLVTAGRLARQEDVFHLPLPSARAAAADNPPTIDLRPLAAAGRVAFAAALRAPPPLPAQLSPVAGLSASILRGHGTGGQVVGHIHRHDPTGAPPPPTCVLLATTLLPTELPLLQVAALITETGGPLDHVATQARERALPAVVGVTGALDHLHPGDLVLVDADAGLIIPCLPPTPHPH